MINRTASAFVQTQERLQLAEHVAHFGEACLHEVNGVHLPCYDGQGQQGKQQPEKDFHC